MAVYVDIKGLLFIKYSEGHIDWVFELPRDCVIELVEFFMVEQHAKGAGHSS